MTLDRQDGGAPAPFDVVTGCGDQFQRTHPGVAIGGDAFLLAALRILEDRNEMVSHSNRFRNYYARRVMTMPELTGFNQKAIEEAFERLLREGKVEVSKRIGASRHVRNGVFVVRDSGDYERPSDVDFE